MSNIQICLVVCLAAILPLASCGTGSGTGGSASKVELLIADPMVYVGSYHRIEVKIDPTSGLALEDLSFAVPGGAVAGDVSLSRERDDTSSNVTLLVGPRTGSHDLVATETATGTELARLTFQSTTRWSDEVNGPSLWFTGRPLGADGGGSAWGGGPGTPQNLDVRPALGIWRVAIVLVDSSSQRYTAAEAAATRREYMDHAVDGVVEGAVTRSAAAWFNEVSYGRFNMTAQAFGPYQLDDVFGTYIEDGAPKRSYFQACLEAADDDIDYNNFDSVVCVMRTDETTDPAVPLGAWAYSDGENWGPYTTEDGTLGLRMVSMSSTWDTSFRRVFETLSHELCHNLGLGDQYDPAVSQPPPSTDSRNLDAWGMMHSDQHFPHLAVAHRMMLGWIDRSWIRNLDFSRASAPVDEEVTLEAIERGVPFDTPHNVLEIRIADGWNYYFEYRNPQAAQIADQNLPRPGSVLGTEAVTVPAGPRPFLLLLPNDADGDGSVLQTGENFRQFDVSDPSNPTEFRVDVTGLEDRTATLRVRYGVHGRPDPSIRPRPSPDGRYQSPDIVVHNARNLADPRLANIPWAGHPNTIRAYVTNRGNVQAENVVVNIYRTALTAGGATEELLGSQTRTIAPDARVPFEVEWTPDPSVHSCIVVRIPTYVTPAGIIEQTARNNQAQTNYTRFISDTASPARRDGTTVTVGNPFALPTRVRLVATQTNPYYRTFLEHQWVTLAAGEQRAVRVWFEHAGRLPELGDPDNTNAKPEEPNSVIVRAFIDDPRQAQLEAPLAFDGVNFRIDTGRATEIAIIGDDDGNVTGTIRTVDDGEEVQGGRVIVSYESPDNMGRVGHQVVPVAPDGTFNAEAPGDWNGLFATYLPDPSSGLAESEGCRIRPPAPGDG